MRPRGTPHGEFPFCPALDNPIFEDASPGPTYPLWARKPFRARRQALTSLPSQRHRVRSAESALAAGELGISRWKTWLVLRQLACAVSAGLPEQTCTMRDASSVQRSAEVRILVVRTMCTQLGLCATHRSRAPDATPHQRAAVNERPYVPAGTGPQVREHVIPTYDIYHLKRILTES